MRYEVDYNATSIIEEFLEENKNNALEMCYDAMGDISLALSDYRHDNNLSQKEMADKLGITQPMVSKIEGGDYNFTIEFLCNICDKLGWDFSVKIEKGQMNIVMNQKESFRYNTEQSPLIEDDGQARCKILQWKAA